MTSNLALGLAAAVLLLWLIVRQARKKDDPYEQHRRRFREIDNTLRSRQGAVDAGLAAELDELDRLQNRAGDSRRSGGNSR